MKAGAQDNRLRLPTANSLQWVPAPISKAPPIGLNKHGTGGASSECSCELVHED